MTAPAKIHHHCDFCCHKLIVCVFDCCMKESHSLLQHILLNGWPHCLGIMSVAFILRGCLWTVLVPIQGEGRGCTFNVRKNAFHFLSPTKQWGGRSKFWMAFRTNNPWLLRERWSADSCRWIWQRSQTPARPSVSRFPHLMSALNKVTAKCQGLQRGLGQPSHLSPQTAHQGRKNN